MAVISTLAVERLNVDMNEIEPVFSDEMDM